MQGFCAILPVFLAQVARVARSKLRQRHLMALIQQALNIELPMAEVYRRISL
ncbi:MULTISPECIES: hypothetical protein [unclassified Microcoleus]|nr:MULTISPECIES: hypothetical protein [unclassified Microcoleus]MCC3463587.1 hypothetical protein [Microcoleus sp. PH2017_11_PCY_U_A]MCC3481932.1 hypothetical protein [Microcoleus sp. PH2017_12_PCY_D_A]